MKRLVLVSGCLVLLVAGCGPAKRADEPPMIRPGQDACAYCGMIVNEVKYAAAQRTAAGEEQVFDDIGDLLDQQAEHGAQALAWVHDFQDASWLRAAEAFYVAAPDLKTPMGSGIAAFRAREAADAFAAGSRGRVLVWAEMPAFRKAFLAAQQQ